MRAPSDLPKQPRRQRKAGSHRGRIIIIVVAVLLAIIFLSARFVARFYTDYLWFDSLKLSGVFTAVLRAKLALAAIFTSVFFVLLFVNLYIADKLAPAFRTPGPEEDFLQRYHQVIGPRLAWIRVLVAALFALIAGVGVSGQWRQWLLFTHDRSFNIKDPQFHTDVGFYIFRLPFLNFLVSWLFASLVIVLVITSVAHYLNGGIRLQVAGNRVTPQVKVHLSLLLGGLAILKACGYWLQRYGLVFSHRGFVNGAGYTDVKAQLPAIYLLVAISVTSFVLLMVNVRRRGWVLPVLAVGLWGLIALIAGAIYPAFIQRFIVQPSESTKERPYIERNIAATQQAFGLAKVATAQYPLDQSLTGSDLAAAKPTLTNVRLVDPDRILDTFRLKEGKKTYYTFNQLDIDRYAINGVVTPVDIAARELNGASLPQQSWEGVHVAYTHGFGITFAPANKIAADGNPTFVDQADPKNPPKLTQENVYFGENLPGYSVVGANRAEVSLTLAGADSTNRYQGSGGVSMGSFVRRVAFALRFGEPNLLVSKLITGSSRILYVRDIRDRVQTLAPFLSYDSDPYPVVLDGRLLWVIDGYTTTDKYPYGQIVSTDDLPATSGLKGKRFNYIRNSVKAVVDAYDGTTSFYVIDPTDPLISAYQAAFPKLFQPASKLPAGLDTHFRYPQDLFRIQTIVWARYHVAANKPDDFYQRSGWWSVAQDPGSTQEGAGNITTQSTNATGAVTITSSKRRIDPYYTMLQLPQESKQSFVMLRPFVPYSATDDRQELISFMVAASDPGTYGQLHVYTLAVPDGGTLPDGPLAVQSTTQSNADISRQLSLLDTNGSKVEFGTLQLLPLGKSVMWVRPLYVRPKGQSDLPVVRKVIVTFNRNSFMDDSFELALKDAFGSSPDLGTIIGGGTPTSTPPTTSGGGGSTTTTTTTPSTGSTDVNALLAQASDLYDQAQAALLNKDLATYQQKINQAFALVKQAAELRGAITTTTVPPTTSTSSPASATTPVTTGATTTTKA